MRSRPAHPLVLVAAIALAYFGAAKLGFTMAFAAEQVTVIWPPTGIALSAVLLFGNRIWPGIALGAFAANITAHEPIAVAAGIACGNTLEALAGAWLLRRVRFDNALVRLRDVLALLAVAAIATQISATIGISSLVLGGLQPGDVFASLWVIWWLGDAIGALLVTPAILTWACRRSELAIPHRKIGEAALVLAGVIAIGQIIFADHFERPILIHQLAYAVFPFSIWAALRFGQRGTATVILIASAMATWGTVRGLGPFSGPSVGMSLVQLQIFMAVAALTSLMLAAALAEHRAAQLRRHTDYTAVRLLAERPTLEEAAPGIVRALGENHDGDLAVLWMADGASATAGPGCGGAGVPGDLRCVAAWRRPGVSLALDPGFAERIAVSRNPSWTPDVLDGSHPRTGVIAFGAPIVLGQEAMGAIEVRGLDMCNPDDDLLAVLGMVANEISLSVARRRAEMEREELLTREQAARTQAEDLVHRLQLVEAELRRGDRAKSEFLAILGHELRNPLAPLTNAVELLRIQLGGDPDVERLLGILERQLRHLVRLVDDLLDFSRIAQGRIELRKEHSDLGELMAHAVDAVRPMLAERHHELELAMAKEPLWVEADPMRIEQVFANLLTNAAKFTEPGGRIHFGAERVGNEAVVRVRDNGMGIAPEMLEIIFDLFAQADRERPRAQGEIGLGIGLALVRSLITMHGGSVTAASGGAGQGSEFTVRLPLAPAKTEVISAAPQAADGIRPQRVLIVDDNKDAAESLALLLREAGHHVELAYDGVSALAKARSQKPETVFLDIHLAGGIDGYEVARRLRAERDIGDVCVVSLTGFGLDEDRRRSEEAGIDHHVVKPVDPEHLREIMRGTFGSRFSAAGSSYRIEGE